MLRHFDGIQLGLTATPCTATEADMLPDAEDGHFVRDTLRFFGLKEPTFRYTLREAIGVTSDGSVSSATMNVSLSSSACCAVLTVPVVCPPLTVMLASEPSSSGSAVPAVNERDRHAARQRLGQLHRHRAAFVDRVRRGRRATDRLTVGVVVPSSSVIVRVWLSRLPRV